MLLARYLDLVDWPRHPCFPLVAIKSCPYQVIVRYSQLTIKFARLAIYLNVVQSSLATAVSSCPSVFNFSYHYYLHQQHR
jgi:hypothetical protein